MVTLFEVNWNWFFIVIKNFELGYLLVVCESLNQRQDNFFFDFWYVIDKVVMAEAKYRATFEQTFICATTESESVHSTIQIRILLYELNDLLCVSNFAICK